MKRISLIVLVGLAISCSKSEQPDSKLYSTEFSDFDLRGDTKYFEQGISLHCMELNESDQSKMMFRTRSLDQSLKLELWNGFIHKNECRPFLVTKDCLSEPIDTLYLGKRKCYFGTDSSYNPFLEIKTDRTIIVKDSSRIFTHNGFKSITSENGDIVIVPLGKQITFVSTQVYKISSDGIIEQIDYQYVEYDV